jgi:hypothetical protein
MHDLVRRGSKDYYCTVCRQSWTYKSDAHCPGIPVIPYNERGTLMSRVELGQRGYKNDPEYLPKPKGVYRTTSGHNYVVVYAFLYDSEQCVRKEPKRKTVIQYIESLHWPKAWLPFLEDISQWAYNHDRRNPNHVREWQQRFAEVVRMASAIHRFTEDELKQFGEDYVVLTFSLTAIRAHWTESSTSIQQADMLMERLLQAYRGQREAKPLSDVAIEVNRRLKAARENQERIVREKGLRVAPDYLLPPPQSEKPAKQQAMF